MSFPQASPHARRLGPHHVALILDPTHVPEASWEDIESGGSRTNPLGFNITAKCPINPGTMVLKERPYLKFLHPSYRISHCTNCFHQLKHRIKCRNSQCRWSIMYCSPECEEDYWTNGIHHLLCRLPEARRFSQQVLMAFEGYIKGKQLPLSIRRRDGPVIPGLVSNIHRHTLSDVSQYRVNAEELKSFFYLPEEAVNCLVTIQGQIRCNSFSIQHTVSQSSTSMVIQKADSLGTGIYLSASTFNHACTPNAVVTFGSHPLDLYVITSHPITSAGESLWISYGPVAAKHPIQERRSFLNDHYFFECNCDACMPTRGSSLESIYRCHKCPNGRMRFQQLKCLVCGNSTDWSVIIKIETTIDYNLEAFKYEKALSLQEEIYDHEAYTIGRTVDSLAQIHASKKDYDQSIEYSKRSLQISKKTFGEVSLETAEEMMKMAGLYFAR
ncbi:hypothetical protein BDF14DRAFT_1765416 [Spinellus fusiger]|nr:hypothetical protein BDF14DRAFT_1765416 [Spinellus fusiger]